MNALGLTIVTPSFNQAEFLPATIASVLSQQYPKLEYRVIDGSYLDTNYPLAADFELWARFFQQADFYTVAVPLGGFRVHQSQRSVVNQAQYQVEAERVLS